MSTVEPSLAGPTRPQDRIDLSGMKNQWRQDLSNTFGKASPASEGTVSEWNGEGGTPTNGGPVPTATVPVEYEGAAFEMTDGAVVIAAITSCTNTSNPDVMIGAGLVARNARKRGIGRKPWVKTSLAPGSQVVTEYLTAAGLTEDLEAAGFFTVGYGCTTCIGNSGPLPPEISEAINRNGLVAAAVLSGNRNFEGRISPDVRANYLASPPLVVAYALAGTVDWDPVTEPFPGTDVYLRDVWPSASEIDEIVTASVTRDQFVDKYADVFSGSREWKDISTSGGAIYDWNPASTYIQEPPFFQHLGPEVAPIQPIEGGRVLAWLGDSVTTDHISPAGSIKLDSPAGRYLVEQGVPQAMFNSYGSRRGNDRVMTRGTFANIRVRNLLAPGTEGGWTTDLLDGTVKSIYEASLHYQAEGVPLVVLAGKDYGMGSSRDWAAKGTFLLGVKAVIAESFERIHRSNLVMMGVLPLAFPTGTSASTLGLDGTEAYSIQIDEGLSPRQEVPVTATKPGSGTITFTARCRVETPIEIDYLRHGGILHYVLREMAAG
jgi:aconitate hydratase